MAQWLGKGILKSKRDKSGKCKDYSYGDIVDEKIIDEKTLEFCKKNKLLGEVPKAIDIDGNLKKENEDLRKEIAALNKKFEGQGGK